MQSRARALVVLGVIAVAVALFAVLKGNDSSSSTTTTANGKPLVITIDKSGKPVGGVASLTVNHGGTIHFTVDSAVADEVHLHGYDIPKDVTAGGSVTFNVPATIEGVFEAELESRHEKILDLTVNP
ncbi:MAG: hypothetical protein QOD60_355 [Solirubrobacterales bacterium]|jgi:hypothetical protein|nr:hypothetical protein [Solirubrobacterales bacterium]